ncbi:MAG: LacI family DNA-binding transcriptional regulator [Dysgonamonadaceae bacterium]|jgi:LacI family transcriptional regulator|nr:LacI family DNA-binding transcriptional regulator [Dysgonamonadaceae bacterium]
MDIHPQHKIRIKDIARLSGVSEGTVDRVIHHRGDVSAKSAEAVNKVLKELDYSPNLLARSLASKKHYLFMCLLPSHQSGDYWAVVDNSFDEAAREFENYNVSIEKNYFDPLDASSFVEATESVFSRSPEAVIFPPVFQKETLAFTAKLAERHIPFSFFDSMMDDTGFLTYYGQHSFQSGYVAAKLLLADLPEKAKVLVTRTQRKQGVFSNQTSNRHKGFLKYIEEHGLHKRLQLIDLLLKDDDDFNLLLLREIIIRHGSIQAAVTFNSKVYRLVGYLESLQLTGVRLLGYDLLQKNAAYLKQGVVSYLIAQRPEKQVYCSVRDMCRELIFKQSVTKINYVPIDILMKENIDYYMNFKE